MADQRQGHQTRRPGAAPGAGRIAAGDPGDHADHEGDGDGQGLPVRMGPQDLGPAQDGDQQVVDQHDADAHGQAAQRLAQARASGGGRRQPRGHEGGRRGQHRHGEGQRQHAQGRAGRRDGGAAHQKDEIGRPRAGSARQRPAEQPGLGRDAALLATLEVQPDRDRGGQGANQRRRHYKPEVVEPYYEGHGIQHGRFSQSDPVSKASNGYRPANAGPGFRPEFPHALRLAIAVAPDAQACTRQRRIMA